MERKKFINITLSKTDKVPPSITLDSGRNGGGIGQNNGQSQFSFGTLSEHKVTK